MHLDDPAELRGAAMPTQDVLQDRLDDLRTRHGVPGAVLGVSWGHQRVICASGTTRLPDGPQVTSDTLFLIASITKVWTATLVLQLVDEGRVALDAPARGYIDPPLRLADERAAETVTVRQLLTHTGGFVGDAPEPPDRGDDAVRRTVEGYARLPQVHQPGRLWSYANSGYNVLGRLVECLTGLTWDQALRERLLDPLGLRNTTTLPEHAMVHPVAVGHVPTGPHDHTLRPVTVWNGSRGDGPCGSSLATTAADLLTFARMHLHDGMADDGAQLLSAASARLMRQAHAAQPNPATSPGWGLGWGVERISDPVVIEHGGNTCGQMSDLVLVPEHDFAICVLTNGDREGQLRQDLTEYLMRGLLDLSRPRIPAAATSSTGDELDRFVGSYRIDEDVLVRVEQDDELLVMHVSTSGDAAAELPSFSTGLTYATGTTFLFTQPTRTQPSTVTFLFEDPAAASASHAAMSLRAAPRVDAAP